MRMTAFAKYDRMAASTRQRLLQYVPYLASQGIEVDYHPLLGDQYVDALATGRSYSRAEIARSYVRRMKALAGGVETDLIWVYAELFPHLPGLFERLAFRSGKPVVYDFDDAVFLPYDTNPNPLKRALLGGKLEPLLRGASLCLCGNAYLRDYAARFCENSIILPTVVDTDVYRPAAKGEEGPVTIGWIGSPTTWPYLRAILPVLEQLAKRHGTRIRVVGAGAAAEQDRFEGLELADWSEEREVAEVQKMDVGVMPLPDEPWARGKCGYKLIQYMACGLPVVASPVGVNGEIVADGISGYLATGVVQWEQALSTLAGDAGLRRAMGEAGRSRIVADYSLAAHAPRFANALEALPRS